MTENGQTFTYDEEIANKLKSKEGIFEDKRPVYSETSSLELNNINTRDNQITATKSNYKILNNAACKYYNKIDKNESKAEDEDNLTIVEKCLKAAYEVININNIKDEDYPILYNIAYFCVKNPEKDFLGENRENFIKKTKEILEKNRKYTLSATISFYERERLIKEIREENGIEQNSICLHEIIEKLFDGKYNINIKNEKDNNKIEIGKVNFNSHPLDFLVDKLCTNFSITNDYVIKKKFKLKQQFDHLNLDNELKDELKNKLKEKNEENLLKLLNKLEKLSELDKSIFRNFDKEYKNSKQNSNFNLGFCYEFGIDNSKDKNKASLTYGSQDKNTEAINKEGIFYYKSKDIDVAIKHFKQAAAQGNKNAIENLRLIGVKEEEQIEQNKDKPTEKSSDVQEGQKPKVSTLQFIRRASKNRRKPTAVTDESEREKILQNMISVFDFPIKDKVKDEKKHDNIIYNNLEISTEDIGEDINEIIELKNKINGNKEIQKIEKLSDIVEREDLFDKLFNDIDLNNESFAFAKRLKDNFVKLQDYIGKLKNNENNADLLNDFKDLGYFNIDHGEKNNEKINNFYRDYEEIIKFLKKQLEEKEEEKINKELEDEENEKINYFLEEEEENMFKKLEKEEKEEDKKSIDPFEILSKEEEENNKQQLKGIKDSVLKRLNKVVKYINKNKNESADSIENFDDLGNNKEVDRAIKLFDNELFSGISAIEDIKSHLENLKYGEKYDFNNILNNDEESSKFKESFVNRDEDGWNKFENDFGSFMNEISKRKVLNYEYNSYNEMFEVNNKNQDEINFYKLPDEDNPLFENIDNEFEEENMDQQQQKPINILSKRRGPNNRRPKNITIETEQSTIEPLIVKDSPNNQIDNNKAELQKQLSIFKNENNDIEEITINNITINPNEIFKEINKHLIDNKKQNYDDSEEEEEEDEKNNNKIKQDKSINSLYDFIKDDGAIEIFLNNINDDNEETVKKNLTKLKSYISELDKVVNSSDKISEDAKKNLDEQFKELEYFSERFFNDLSSKNEDIENNEVEFNSQSTIERNFQDEENDSNSQNQNSETSNNSSKKGQTVMMGTAKKSSTDDNENNSELQSEISQRNAPTDRNLSNLGVQPNTAENIEYSKQEMVNHLSNLYYLIGTSNEYNNDDKAKIGVAVAHMLNARGSRNGGADGVVATLKNLVNDVIDNDIGNKTGVVAENIIEEIFNSLNEPKDGYTEYCNKLTLSIDKYIKNRGLKNEKYFRQQLENDIYGVADKVFIDKAKRVYNKKNGKNDDDLTFLNNFYNNFDEGRKYIQQTTTKAEENKIELKDFYGDENSIFTKNDDEIIDVDDGKLEEAHKALNTIYNCLSENDSKTVEIDSNIKKDAINFTKEQIKETQEAMDHAERVKNQFELEKDGDDEKKIKGFKKDNNIEVLNTEATRGVRYPDDYSEEYMDLVDKTDNFINVEFHQDENPIRLGDLEDDKKDKIKEAYGIDDENETIERILINGIEFLIPTKYCDWIEINKGIGRERGVLPGMLEYMKKIAVINGGNVDKIKDLISLEIDGEKMTIAEAIEKGKGSKVAEKLLGKLSAVASDATTSLDIFLGNDKDLFTEVLGEEIVNGLKFTGQVRDRGNFDSNKDELNILNEANNDLIKKVQQNEEADNISTSTYSFF